MAKIIVVLQKSIQKTVPLFTKTLSFIILVLLCASYAEANTTRLSPENNSLGESWRFESEPNAAVTVGELKADANGVLHLRFDFNNSGKSAAAYCKIKETGLIESISFRLRKPAEATINVHVTDSEGETFQKRIIYEHGNWQQLKFYLKDWNNHWGGKDSSDVAHPIKSVKILIEKRGLKSPKGEVLIADMSYQLSSKDAVWLEKYSGEYVVTNFDAASGFQCHRNDTFKDGLWTVNFGKSRWNSLYNSISLLGKPKQLTLKVCGGDKGTTLQLQVSSHFQVFSRILGTLNGGEQTFTVPAPPEGWNRWKGTNEGHVRYPLRITSLALVREEKESPKPVQLKLIETRCITEISRAETLKLLANLTEISVSGDKRTLSATCNGWNLLDQDIKSNLILTVCDWENNVLYEENIPWTIPAKGVQVKHTCSISVPSNLNFVEAEFSFAAAQLPPVKAMGAYARPLDDAGDATIHPESPWGMGLYLSRYSNTPEGLAAMEKAAAMAQAAGVKWAREVINWQSIEPEPGKYDFDHTDKIITTEQRHGISVYGMLGYWSEWTQAYTEKGIEDACRWVRAVVAHYKNRINYWEIYNEPNIFFWKGPKELYPVLVKKCYAAIKEEDPQATVMAVSTSKIDFDFLQLCMDSNMPFDILTIHPYRSDISEDYFMQELKYISRQANNRTIWITEMGRSTEIGGWGVDYRRQAELLARSYLVAIGSGVCQNFSWYDFHNDGTDQFYHEQNVGVLHYDLTPKPSYRALATMCRTLDSGKPIWRTDFGKNIYALEMGDGLALWTSEKLATVTVREEGGTIKVSNLMGETIIPQRSGQEITIKLRCHLPVFIKGADIKPVNAVPIPPSKDTANIIIF